jgi:hypothetical protein
MGEQPVAEGMSAGPVVTDTFAGRIHVEWDNSATVTPLGQLRFFVEYLKHGVLFDGFVADCPLYYRSLNAPAKRDVLGTVLLSILAGHWRYAHMTTLRCDPVNPPLLGMSEVVSEDAVRRGLDKETISDYARLMVKRLHAAGGGTGSARRNASQGGTGREISHQAIGSEQAAISRLTGAS